MSEEIFYRQIQDYLKGTLSEDQMRVFEDSLATDETLKKEFLLEKQLFDHFDGKHEFDLSSEKVKRMRTFINSEEGVNLKSILRDVGDEYKPVKKIPFKKLLYGLAASLAILFSALFIINTQSTQSDDLYASYYTSKDLPALLKRDSNDLFLQQGALAFKNEDFERAINSFDSYLKKDEIVNSDVYLYLGLSHGQLGNVDLAIKYFDNFIVANSLDAPKGKWFKAMVYLKNNKIAEAKKILNSMNSDYKEQQSRQLLEALDEF